MRFTVVTINILNELSLWPRRKELLRRGLEELSPDAICVQEASLAVNNHAWLAEELGYSHFLTPKTGEKALREGIAILSRLPVVSKHVLDLETQFRVAQAAVLQGSEGEILLVNGHFFWQPGESDGRLQQVERLLEWIPTIAGDRPVVVCGDFNGEPESRAIVRMRERYVSAYAAAHGREPDYTCPTPLPMPKMMYVHTLIEMYKYIFPFRLKPGWKGTLDYIFTGPQWQVKGCEVVLNMPSPDNPRLYPSDHFGLWAELEYRRSEEK